MFNIIIDSIKKYKHYKKVIEAEKRAGLNVTIYQIFKRRLKIYKQYKRGFEIGKRAAQGYNIYLTFGSDKTITKDVEDSYRRYSMAMKHYNQVLCDEKGFFEGYRYVRMNSKLVNKVLIGIKEPITIN